MSGGAMLTVGLKAPASSEPPPKPKETGNPLLDKWFFAQWEIACGRVPNILGGNAAQFQFAGRQRAPTTADMLQDKLNNTTTIQDSNTHYEAGDYTDDEEEDPDDDVSLSISIENMPTGPPEVSDEMSREEEATARRQLARRLHGRTSRMSVRKNTIKNLWLKSQAELQEGKQPTILRKYGDGYRIQDLRKYHKRFQHTVRRSDQYMALEINLSGRRANIDKDLDEDEEEDSVYQRGSVTVDSTTRPRVNG